MGVTYLVDTHVLLWLLSDPVRVPAPVLAALAAQENALLVSSVSGLELTTKVRIGKLDAADLLVALPRRLRDIGALVLDVSMEHALLAGSMSWPHRDPFDRLLVAQASIESATLVSVDAAMQNLPAPRVLSW